MILNQQLRLRLSTVRVQSRQLFSLPKIYAFNNQRTATRPRILAMGDSHVTSVEKASVLSLLDADVSTVWVGGATAQGLVNPQSVTNALRLFERRSALARTWQPIVLQLGEVDCGFLIWYRAQKYGISVESQLVRSLDGFRTLIESQVNRGFKVIVLSAPLPTIPDGQKVGEVANLRLAVTATQLQRTELTLEYNRRLQAMCEALGAIFADATTPTFDPQTGLVRPEYLNEDPADHHLNYELGAELTAKALTPLL